MTLKIYCLVPCLIFILLSCNENKSKLEFENNLEIKNQEGTLILSDFGYTQIPDEIGLMTDLNKLTISKEDNKWLVYPPRSAWVADKLPVKSNKLTNEITKLKQLKILNIGFMDLTSLPNDFHKLQHLDSLNLMMNYLDITNELSKLKKLENLRYINILGNKLDTLQIKNWQEENNGLTIVYDWKNLN